MTANRCGCECSSHPSKDWVIVAISLWMIGYGLVNPFVRALFGPSAESQIRALTARVAELEKTK